VDPSNTNVSEVQFVYVVDGVKEAKSSGEKSSGSKSSSKSESASSKKDKGSSSKSSSFMERLGALFSGKKENE
jgi:putative membrane protein